VPASPPLPPLIEGTPDEAPAAVRRPRRPWGPEHVFAGLVALFGLAFAFGLPPCQAPDEVSHFFRAYQVSEGRLFPAMVGEWGGGELPAGVVEVASTFAHLAFHGDLQATRDNFARVWEAPLDPGERTAVPFPGGAFYTFVPYVPQALGIALGRAAGLNGLGVFYAGRLANMALAVLLVYLAVRVIPIFKVVLGTVALIPMSIHQLASLSPDSSTIAVAFLLTAVLFRLALGAREAVAGRGVVAVLFALAGWLTLCKFPYAALGLLYLAVPSARLGGRRRYLLTGVALFLVVGALAAAGTQMKRFAPDRLTTDAAAGVSMERQLRFIRSQPLRYAHVVAATVAEHGQVWLDQMGTLGWLDTPVNPLAMHAFFTILVLTALGDRTAGINLGFRLKGAALLAAVAGAGIILTSCYVCGCRYKAPLIVGPQGRYFIPLLPSLLLLLYNQTVQVKAAPRVLLALAAGGGSAVLLVAVVNFVRRYYFPTRLHTLFAPAALAAGLLLFVSIVALARRRAAAAE
jgi:uncharacterized membrane protein